MEKFVQKPGIVEIHESTFLSLKGLLKFYCSKVVTANHSVLSYHQVSLLAVIKLLEANLKCLKLCKIPLHQILEPDHVQDFKCLKNDCLAQIKSFNNVSGSWTEAHNHRIIVN